MVFTTEKRPTCFLNRSGDGRHLSVEPADPDLDSLDEADEGDEYSNEDLDSEMDEIRQKMMDLQVKTKDKLEDMD